MAPKQDEELTLLLTKLYDIQEQVGAKEKTSAEEKRNRAEQAGQVTMGKGKKGKKTGSRFLELKSSIVDRLKTCTNTNTNTMAPKQDEELTLLLTKLYDIQEQVGAKEKTSAEEKRNRAEQAGQVTMGKGKKGKKTGSRFLELKSSIVHFVTIYENNNKD
ncbi:hypothetical protein ACHAXT_010809 [Thalassiosira profunda]